MRRLYAAAILSLALMTGPTYAKPKHCSFRVHCVANANDTSTFAQPVQSSRTGQRTFIERVPTISEHDVEAFRPYPADDGTFGVLIQLNQHGKLALDTLSIERRGTFLFVFVNKRPLAELQIDRRVSDGRIYLAHGLTAADVDLMRKDWLLIGQKKKK